MSGAGFLWPLALLWAAGAAAFFLDGRSRAAAALAVIALAAALGGILVLLASSTHAAPPAVVTGHWPKGVGVVLRPEVPGLLFAAVSLATLLAALLYEAIHGVLTRSFPAVLLLLGAGLTGLFLTGDIFNFYVFFEVAMVASFVLAAYAEEPSEVRGATVFALVNLLGSAFFIGAVAGIYRATGTLEMSAAAEALQGEDGPRLLVATLVLMAFALKLGLFPLHFWLPAVYRDTRPVVAAVLSAAVATIGSYGLLRFGIELFPAEIARFEPVLLGIGAASVLYGGVLAVSRRAASEVLGYSAIGQVGYVLVALAVGGTTGLAAAFLYAVVNSLNKLVLFLAAGARGPLVGVVFAIGAASVAGIPPTVGFAGKLELFRMAVGEGSAWIAALLLAGGALSVAYMFQAWQHRFWAGDAEQSASPLAARSLLALLGAVVVALGCWPEPLVAASRAAAVAILEAKP